MPSKKAVTIEGECHCLRCDHRWWPKRPLAIYRPQCCAACKSRLWDVPKMAERSIATTAS